MRASVLVWAGLALGLLACAEAPEPSARLEPATEPADTHGGHDHAHAEPAPAAAAEAPDGAGVLHGAALDDDMPLTTLASILDSPETHADRVVRTEGEIARVCQRMGCWMELRESEDGPAVRIPMAGHSFFLPRDAAGRHAQIQGRVALRELSPEARAHLESEGAVATASALSIEATGVLIL